MIEAQSDKEAKASEQNLSNNKNTQNQQFNFKSIKNAERPSIIHVILLNRTLRILCLLGIFCTLIPIADYFYFYSSQIVEHQTDDSGSSICSHYPIYQIPCGVENISKPECMQLDCCYSSKTGCYHFLPSKYQYRVSSNQPWSSSQYLSPTKMLSPLSTTAASRIKLDIQEISEDILSLALWNSDKFSSPLSSSAATFATTTLGISSSIENEKNFQYKVFSPEMFVEVRRRSSGKILLSTSRGALIMSDGYFEWSFYLGNNMTLMGFGELELNPGQILLINNDVSSVLPFVVAFDAEDKQYHAVYFQSLHSPTEVEILKSNVIVVRQFFSSSFELKLFIGPTYDDIYRQLTKHLAHYRAKEIWTLGIHVCHSSSSSSTFLNITEAQIELDHLLSDENVKSIPFDSHCLTSGMTSNVISSKSHWQTAIESFGVVEFIERLQSNRKKLLFHVNLSMVEVATAAVSVVAANDNDDDEMARKNHNEFYRRAIDGKLFLRDHDGANFVGISEKTTKVFYLDYVTKSQEIADLLTFRWRALSNFLNFTDGIFITKSSPQDDTVNKSFAYLEDEFKFKPKNFERYVTNLVPLNLKTSSLHDEMLIHQLNNFGRSQTHIFQQHINKDEGKFCITDSYREDTECAVLIKEPNPGWITFKSIVYKSVWHSMIGIPIYGCEVCGSSDGNIQEDLCIRWYQFAIFAPLFYVKSDRIPLKFSKYSERIMSRAIQTRYTLLSYMRMYIMERRALLKPLRLVYPQLNDHVADITKHQFIFGDSLMIAPVVEPLIRHLDLYFPSKYFEFWSGLEMPQNTSHFSVVMHDIPIFVRAGQIVALNLAYESLSAEDAIQQPYLLIVAFECNEKFSCHSQGRLLVDDGDDAGEGSVEFNFVASENHLNITVITRASGGTRKRNPNEASRNAICDPERRSTTGEFLLAKIYGLGEFKPKYRNDYLSLDLNICTEQVESEDEDATDWNKTFSFLI